MRRTKKEPYKLGIICFPTYGGSGAIATELGIAFGKKKYEIHFICSASPFRLTPLTENIYLHEVEAYNYPLFEYPPYDLAMVSKIIELAKEGKLDLIHAHYAIPHATIAYLARKMLAELNIHLPFITTLHGTDITLAGKDKSLHPIVQFSINQSDDITAVSHALKKETLTHFHTRKNIHVIHNFVNIERFQQCQPKNRDAFCRKEEKLLVHISNFRPVKRIQDIISIFEQVQKVCAAKLVLIGDGPERRHIETLVRQKKLQEKITLLGKIDAIEEILHMADIFLSTSEKESFGLAALEAMASHTPVIAADAGGLHELIENNKNGFIFPIGNVKDMTQKTIELLQNEEKLAQFKKAAYQRALKFDIKHIIPKYEALYKNIMNPTLHETTNPTS